MAYLYEIMVLIYVCVVAAVILTVIMDNRQPAKTMAWVMVLVFIPVGGIVLYFFFGQDTRKEKYISRKSMDRLMKRSMLEFADQDDLVLPPEHSALIKLFASQSWALPFKNNTADIFTDGYGFFCALLRDIGKARNHIHLETYIICDDPLGRLVADALMAKARAGVEVRVIYDDVGCWDVPNSFFERMRGAGVDVHGFMPVRFPAFTSKVNYRNHRKLCVIDGTTGYIGGMNIALRYVKGTPRQAWRDTHLRIKGSAVYGIQQAFLTDWYFVDRTLINNRRYYPVQEQPVSNGCIMQTVTSSPISKWPEMMQGYVRILLEAKQYVYMETPYFLPTEPVMFAMRTAALAGVDVRMIIPLHSDARFVEWASHSYIREAVDAGVKVYMYKAGFNHSKLLVSDDTLSTCGSTNIDFRSFENNFESNVFIYDRDMALRIKSVFTDDMRECVLYEDVMRSRRLSFTHRLWESVVRLFSPLM